jgi:uncharacterized coiled-coil protein SlyX
VGALAVVLSLATMVVAMKRSAQMPRYESREEALAKRVAALESTVATLQSLLYEKQEEIKGLRDRIRQLEAIAPDVQRQRRPVLAVALGADRMLEEDLAMLRGVNHFHLSVLRNAKRSDLERLLERQRSNGTPIQYLHLAMHAGPEGVQFSDGLADGVWLSRVLKDVRVLLIAGCRSDNVGDLLSVVPNVVSMRDEIENADARIFTRWFWTGIGQGLSAEDALYAALERSSAAVGEMVELHL